MMDIYALVKTLHVVSSTVLFGTGLGIAFFMFRSAFTDDLHEKYFAARTTVLADFLFIAPAVFVQPLTGLWLMRHDGFTGREPWLLATFALYLLAGACWLPVVRIQIRLRRIIAASLASSAPLPVQFHRLFRLWFVLGIPAFGGLVVIFFLMVAKPG